MALFTERNHLRKEIEKTYNISPEAYELLFKTCYRYLIHLAWLFPLYCPDDGASIYSYNEHDLVSELKFDIPDLIDNDAFIKPVIKEDVFTNEKQLNYNQYAILDFIEYVFQNIKDYREGYHHQFFNHAHIYFLETNNSRTQFLGDVNKMFARTGLLYELKFNGEIERIVLNDSVVCEVRAEAISLQDKSLKDLIDDSISSFLKPGPKNMEHAVEKIWDAFERVKTYYVNLDKKASIAKLVETISEGQSDTGNVIDREFAELTKLGNEYRIRHHETNKIEFISDNHREYFFNRCLAILSLTLKYIK